MCGRYHIGPEGEDWVREIMAEIESRPDSRAVLPHVHLGEIAPGDIAPVLAHGGPRLMQWGWAGSQGRIINARSETALEKPLFRQSLLAHRCLLPADRYYEWKRTAGGAKSKQKYAFFIPRRPLFMAGFWQAETEWALPSFVILTRDAPPDFRDIHDRMPVILPPALRRDWLAGDNPTEIMNQAVLDLSFQPVEKGMSS